MSALSLDSNDSSPLCERRRRGPLTSIGLALCLAVSAGACGDDAGGSTDPVPSPDAGADVGVDGVADAAPDASTDGGTPVNPTTYAFAGRDGSDSSVSYSGQTARHVLIAALKAEFLLIDERIDAGSFAPAEGDVVAALDFYFQFDGTIGGLDDHPISTDPAASQTTFDDISTDKNLIGKFAGNDTATDYRDFSTEFAGWSDASIAANGGGISSPTELVTAFFNTVEENAIARADAADRTAFDGTALPSFVTESGLNLRQLSQKLLTVGLTFHQGVDDYLDDDVDGKGLLASNIAEEGSAYTPLEHAWDEAFGYFGAARDYANYTDDEIAGKGVVGEDRDDWADGAYDTNQDGAIDLTSEWNTALAVNAAKRDSAGFTDFTGDAYSAFLAGRTLIANIEGELSADQLDTLRAHRDDLATAWEGALAATVIHYINDVLEVMTSTSGEYDFLGHAKAWSELKGFALGFQFNPRSPMLSDFGAFHTLIGDAPVLSNAGDEANAAYVSALRDARTLLADAFDFPVEALGDDNGLGGW
ncbi:MAG: hypothetical protein ACI81R_002496 [Bradymonadia bacterium]|jgi:hypothetical protein